MTTIWKFTKFVLILLVLGLILWAVMANYSILFAKTVVGEITAVEKVELPVALMTRQDNADLAGQVFSFSVGIRDEHTGEIHTAFSEDRQWAVAQVGKCAEARYLPYPPWDLKRRGTFFGARLIRLYECPAK